MVSLKENDAVKPGPPGVESVKFGESVDVSGLVGEVRTTALAVRTSREPFRFRIIRPLWRIPPEGRDAKMRLVRKVAHLAHAKYVSAMDDVLTPCVGKNWRLSWWYDQEGNTWPSETRISPCHLS